MIKAIILDVDGVVKGSKKGINYPMPHNDVIEALKKIYSKGIPVILCTANYYSSAINIIRTVGLHNPHITDRGALIVNPLDNILLEKTTIDKKVVKEILEVLVPLKSHLEVYSEHGYYVQKDQFTDFAKIRATILQQEPIVTNSLINETENKDIIKINVFANSHNEKERINEALNPFKEQVAYSWVENPSMGTTEVLNITKVGISKPYAVSLILKHLGITTDNALGVGDSVSDWEFMSVCKYVVAMGNANDKLKELVKTKGEGNYFIAPHVDENGLLDVFKHFSLM